MLYDNMYIDGGTSSSSSSSIVLRIVSVLLCGSVSPQLANESASSFILHDMSSKRITCVSSMLCTIFGAIIFGAVGVLGEHERERAGDLIL